MPTCTHCQTEWTWKQTIKKSFTLSNKLACPVCGKSQYIAGKSRKKIGALNMLVLLPMLLNAITPISPLAVIALMFSLFLAVLAYMPFLTELSDKDDPLW